MKEIKSRYLRDIKRALDTGEINETVQGIVNLIKTGRMTIESFTNDENYRFKDDYNPTEEKVNEINKAYEQFIVDNGIIVELYEDEDVVDTFCNAMSLFYDNNNPYAFLLFNETFNVEIIKNNSFLYTEYLGITENAVIDEKLKIYEKWKNKINSFKISKGNKYEIANYLECIDTLISIYENIHMTKIKRTECFALFYPILNEIYNEFNVFDFVEKYYKAIHSHAHTREDFLNMFVEQYLRPYRLKKETKLF
jgi:hypothetical protein